MNNKKKTAILLIALAVIMLVAYLMSKQLRDLTGQFLPIAYILIGLFFAIGCMMLAHKEAKKPLEGNQYNRKESLLSPSEQKFYYTLCNIVGNRNIVMTQVALSSLVDKVGSSFRNELFRAMDYVIVDSSKFIPLVVIELNDASHNRQDRIDRDEKISEICSRAKLNLVSFTLEQSKDSGYVKKTIKKYL